MDNTQLPQDSESRGDEMATTNYIKDLKAEIEILKKTIVQIGSASSNREYVKTMERINFDEIGKSAEDFPVMKIRSLSIYWEISWMKKEFERLKNKTQMSQGESMLVPAADFLQNVKASCTMTFSNFLNSPLSENTFIWNGVKKSGPSEIVGHASEVFTFVGDGNSCSFTSSFAIARELRLTIYCTIYVDRGVQFGIGFIRGDARCTDLEFWEQNMQNSLLPDKCINHSDGPLDLIVSQGNFLARGKLTRGPLSDLHVEIIQFKDTQLVWPYYQHGIQKLTKERTTLKSDFFPNNPGINRQRNYRRFACKTEIVNRLNVKLKNWKDYGNCEVNRDVTSSGVPPLKGARFLTANNVNAQVILSCEIDSTDLAFVVALKFGRGYNSFGAAFVYSPAPTDAQQLVSLMDVKRCITNDYMTFATATEGVKYIQFRNILAELKMTEENHSVMEIRIFAV